MSLVSVIIPVYNAQDTITRCLDSILAQTHKDLQIIVVNDGSTDNSLALCRMFGDSRILIINNGHMGISCARNAGISYAEGEYISFVDADDYFSMPQAIEIMLERSADLVIIMPQAIEIMLERSADLVIMGNDCSVKRYLLRPNKNTDLAFVWGKLFKRSIIEKYKIRFNNLMRKHEDTEFVFHYLYHASSVGFVGQQIYTHQSCINGAGMQIFNSTRDCERLLERIKYFEVSQDLIDHCRISLKIIEIVRAYRWPFMDHYTLVRILLEEDGVWDSLKHYQALEGNSRIIPWLMRHRWYFWLTIVCRIRGTKRYG